jgi:hypothetical protein
MIYSIPKKLKEEIKIFNKPITIYVKDVASAGMMIAFFWMISNFINGYLAIPYWIFAVLCTIYLILPAGKLNQGKRKWQAIYYMIINDMSVYRSIDYISEEKN